MKIDALHLTDYLSDQVLVSSQLGNHLGVVMRFVCLRSAGCVRAGDMMRERERDVVTLELTLGPGRSTVHPLYCVLCPASSAGDEEGDEDDGHHQV